MGEASRRRAALRPGEVLVPRGHARNCRKCHGMGLLYYLVSRDMTLRCGCEAGRKRYAAEQEEPNHLG